MTLTPHICESCCIVAWLAPADDRQCPACDTLGMRKRRDDDVVIGCRWVKPPEPEADTPVIVSEQGKVLVTIREDYTLHGLENLPPGMKWSIEE